MQEFMEDLLLALQVCYPKESSREHCWSVRGKIISAHRLGFVSKADFDTLLAWLDGGIDVNPYTERLRAAVMFLYYPDMEV